jgi:hypothetical protein
MRRATMVLLSAVMMLAIVAGPADAVSRLQKTAGPLPTVKGFVIERACPFPVIWTDRGGRTLTTWDRDHTIVSQRITGTSRVVLTNGATGLELAFDIKETTSILYDQQRGTATTLQRGSSGLVFDTGTISGAGSFTWYAGAALTTGWLDPTTLLYTDIASQHTVGLEGDVCEMLVSGLKTRH